MTFEEKVIDFLRRRFDVALQEREIANSDFPLYFIPQLKMHIHFLYADERLERLPALALQKMSMHYLELKHNIIHLWEDQFSNHEDQIFERLISLSDGNTTVHARQCSIERISQELYEDFLNKSHLMRHARSRYKYGLFKNNELLAVLGLSAGRWMTKEGKPRRSFEIIRFASKPLLTVVGGFTKLLKHAEKELEVDEWMTYIDLDWALVGIYQRFEFQTKGLRAPHDLYIHKESKKREVRVPAEEVSNYYCVQNAGSLKLVKKVERV